MPLVALATVALVVGSQGARAAPRLEVWVHYDYVVEPDGTSYAPDPAAIQMVVDVYAAHGIKLHIDPQHTAIPLTVPYVAMGFDPLFCDGEPPTGNWERFSTLKAEYFHPPARAVGNHNWHYAIYADRPCDRSGEGGESSDIPGDDFVLYPGVFDPRNRQTWDPLLTAGLFMHELGHNLGLYHGGFDGINGKPNYLSVMNYDFNLFGIPVAAAPGDNRAVSQRLDYSEAALPTLDETHLDERVGLGAGTNDISTACSVDDQGFHTCQPVPASGPVDWNGDGIIEPSVSQDIDGLYLGCFPTCPGPLIGFDDWSEIKSYLAQQPPPPGPQPAPPTVTGLSPTGGPVTGGTQVTITGSHLTGATGIRIDGQHASFAVINDHKIVAASPDISGTPGCGRGAGRYDVQVTAGMIASQPTPADIFTYSDVLPHLSAVCVTAVSPHFGSVHGGTQVTLGGWGFTGATYVNFLDEREHLEIEVPSFTVVDDHTITTTAPPSYLLRRDNLAEVFVGNHLNGSLPNLPYDEFTYTGGIVPEPPPPTVTGLSTHGGPAAGGTSVTITGTGFNSAISLTFGRFPQTAFPIFNFTVVNDNTITVLSPPEYSLQTVDVAVFGQGGDSLAVPADRFTYDTPPPLPPKITSVSPTGGPAAGGNTVTVTGSGFTGLTSLQVGMTLLTGGSFTVVNDNTLTFTAPAEAAGTVDLIARNPVGFSLISPADTYAYG